MAAAVKQKLMWHFTTVDYKLRYSDNRMVVAGETLKVHVQPVLCQSGLHASPTVLDALGYAPGCFVWRVRLGGTVLHDNDKSVGTELTALWGYDATEIVLAWSRRVALDALTLYWNASKFGAVPDVVMQFLRTDDKSIADAAANAAAYAAAKKKYNGWLTAAIMKERP